MENQKIQNLTPHGVNIISEEGNLVKNIPSEGVIRLSQSTERVGFLSEEGAKIPLSRTSFGGADQLPPKREGTIYIVSSMVCQACPDRPDFYIPNETVRDGEGRIIGCRALSRNPFYTGFEKEVVL